MKTPYYHLDLDLKTSPQALEEFKNVLTRGEKKPKLVFFVNAHCFNISLRNEEYFNALKNSDFLFNDGIGIKIGARLKGIQVPENMNGTDLIPKIVHVAYQLNNKIFLLGAKEGIADAAKSNIEKKYPGIKMVGTSPGYFPEDQEVVNQINKSGADILIVGMGVPRQELWLTKNKNHLENIKIAIAGGAILDFMAQKVKRAPLWMQKSGLEWFFRFIQEPGRLFKRYFWGNFQFLYYVLFWNYISNYKKTGNVPD